MRPNFILMFFCCMHVNAVGRDSMRMLPWCAMLRRRRMHCNSLDNACDRRISRCMQMQDVREFACNALFGACNVNATKMCYDYVSMHEEKIHIGCTPQNCCWMQCKFRWIFTSNNVTECHRDTCILMRVNANQCDVSNVVLMRYDGGSAFCRMWAWKMLPDVMGCDVMQNGMSHNASEDYKMQMNAAECWLGNIMIAFR